MAWVESDWTSQYQEITKKDEVDLTKLHLLRGLGHRLGMIGDQPRGWPGRGPKDYPLTETMSAEELVALIEQNEQLPFS